MPIVGEINQPFGNPPDRVGDYLVALLSRGTDQFDTVCMAVAFAKSSGVSRIFDQLQEFVSNGGNIRVVVGVDHQGTSRQGLELLLATKSTLPMSEENGSGLISYLSFQSFIKYLIFFMFRTG